VERRPVKHRGGLLSMSLSWYTSVVAIHAAKACACGARVERGPRAVQTAVGRAWGKVRLSYTSRLIRYVVQETGTVHRSHNGRQTAPSQFRRDTVCRAVCAAAAENIFISATVPLAPFAPTANPLRKGRTRRGALAITCLSCFHICTSRPFDSVLSLDALASERAHCCCRCRCRCCCCFCC